MKSMARHAIALIAVAMSLTAFTGCPLLGGASLSVQPGVLSLSDSKPVEQISVTNEGSGTLNWSAESTVGWLLLSFGDGGPQTIVTGSTGTVDIFKAHLVLEALPENVDSLTTEILVRSNGGDTAIPVAISRPVTPKLDIEPASLDFGDSETEKLTEILNRGEAVLQWKATIPQGMDWISITPASGAIARASAEGVMVKVNRAALVPSATPYQVEITVSSNGGTKTLTLIVEAPAFNLSPASLDFGLLRRAETQVVSLQTVSAADISLTSVVVSGAPWLTLEPDTAVINRLAPVDLRITANPGGLDPGTYTGSVSVTHADTGRVVSVPVSMEVGLPVSFRVEPGSINFGDTRGTVQQVVTLVNESDVSFEWTAGRPDSASWLTIDPVSGLLDDTQEITLTADASLLKPGAVNATVVFDAGGVSRLLRTFLNRLPDPVPDSLEVEPRELDFGALLNKKEITLWNEGPSRLDWAIDGASLPAWLTVNPLAGSVEGALVQTVQLSVNRDVAPEDASFSHTLVITPSGAAGLTPVEVTVRAQQRLFPDIIVTGEGVDVNNIAFIMIDIGQDSETFIVRNDGNADLTWAIDMETLPEWITSVEPQQGSLAPGRQRTVTVTTDRNGLDQSGAIYQLAVNSNDPEQPVTYLEVQVRVPFTITIGARPTKLDFGRYLSTLDFEIANMGDAGFPLDFVVTANQPEWIFVEPARGRSMGTGSSTKDWQFVSVAIDRSRIAGTGAAGKLIISAENVPENAYPVAPLEVPVSVDVAELTIETAVPRLRVPSLLRFNMLLRDARQSVFPDFVDNPLDTQTMFRLNTVAAEILEDSEPLDLSETNVIIKKNETLDFAVLIMLDFSASMAEAAEALVADGQLDPGLLPPLEALYLETIGAMLNSLPAHYQVGLAVFNERRPDWENNVRLIRGAPAGHTLKESFAPFTADKAIQQYRLANMDVLDNGATPLYPAVTAGAVALLELDAHLPDFDAVENRILVMVSDGRRTTPPGDLQQLTDFLEGYGVRVFPIGWGNEVMANPLIQLSTESGGHYYATQNKIIPGEVDADGKPVTLPVKENLLDRCRPNPADDAIASVPRDLASHVVVSYVTLNEEDSISIQARMEVSAVDPPVQETALFDQIPASLIANDVRLGQIGMRTEGIQEDGTAKVRLYMDYAPRNITKLVFDIGTTPEQSWTPVLVSDEQGGLVAGWGLNRIGNRITIQSLDPDRPIAYGDYGNLVDINLAGIAAPFTLTFVMVEPAIGGHPDGKYFTVPDLIEVDYEPATAVSFPNPEFEFTPPLVSEISNVIDLGSLEALPEADRNLKVLIDNIGGEHLPTNATLYWKLREGDGYIPGTIPGSLEFLYNGPEPIESDYYSIHDAYLCTLSPADVYDEFGVVTADPGTYSVQFYIDVQYGSLPYEFIHGPYYLQYTVP